MKLHFANAALAAVLAQAERAWPAGTTPIYDQAEGVAPGFWLVGDQGVYLMHNGRTDEKKQLAYAEECDPTVLPFEAWWSAKRASFGGDDGVDYIERDYIETAVKAGLDIFVEITPDGSAFEIGICHREKAA